MALPVTISNLGVDARYFTKPFISSAGNVYVFGRDTAATDELAAHKATDPTSSFSAVGTDVQVVAGVALACMDAFQVGDVVHIATGVGTQSGFHTYYHAFDMSTDSWSITKEAIKSSYTLGNHQQEGRAVGIAVRSDGDVIVLYNGQASSGGKVFYARRESGSWTADIAVDNGSGNWLVGAALLGASDRVHFFFSNFSTDDEYQRTLTSANVLETFPASYDTSVNSSGREQSGTSYVSGGTTKVRYPYSDGTSTDIASARLDSADAPTVSPQTDITGTTSVTNSYFTSTFAAHGTTLWHAFIASADSNIYTQSNADDAGWDTPASFYDDAAAVTTIRANVYTRGSDTVLAIVYSTASAVKYHEKFLASGGVTGSASFTLGAMTLSSAAVAAISGALNKTLDAMTLSSAAVVPVDGAASITLGAATLSSTFSVTTDLTAEAAITLGDLTVASASVVDIVAAGSISLDNMTLSSEFMVGFEGIIAEASFTLGDMTLSSGAVVDVVGTASIQLGDLTATGESTEDGIMGIEAFVAGYDGALGDQIHNFLVDNTTGTDVSWTTQDLWLKFFDELGHSSGSIADRNRQFLLSYLSVSDTGQTLADLWEQITDPYTPAP